MQAIEPAMIGTEVLKPYGPDSEKRQDGTAKATPFSRRPVNG